MTERPERTSEARVAAARTARQHLAVLAQRDATISEAIAPIIASLFSAEVKAGPQLSATLQKAVGALTHLSADVTDPSSSRELSRALAMLYPVAQPEEAPVELTQEHLKAVIPGDRRQTERVAISVAVGLEGANNFVAARTGDLSPGGLFIATDDPLKVGTSLTLAFVLPSGYWVRTDAVVSWVRGPAYRADGPPAGMGIRFEALSLQDREAIADFVRLRRPLNRPD